MIKNVKFFVNNNLESIEYAKLVKEDFYKNGFNVVDKNRYDLGIAIGGDGSFLRMIKQAKFNSKPYYVGINTGHLGFFQEVKANEHYKLIQEIQEEKYKVVNTIIQKTVVKAEDKEKNYYSLNEIVVRDINLDLFNADIYINDDLLENLAADGILLSTPSGSTAYNLSYDGAILYPDFEALQLTPFGALNNKRYHTLRSPIIIPSNKKIDIIPVKKDIKITVDGVNHNHNNVDIITSTGEEKIKCLKFSHYSFTQKINEKLL